MVILLMIAGGIVACKDSSLSEHTAAEEASAEKKIHVQLAELQRVLYAVEDNSTFTRLSVVNDFLTGCTMPPTGIPGKKRITGRAEKNFWVLHRETVKTMQLPNILLCGS